MSSIPEKKTWGLPVQPDNIPQTLKQHPSWVCWKAVEKTQKDGVIKHTKIPVNARTLYNAKTNDGSTWSTFEEALSAYQLNMDTIAGIGFIVKEAYGLVGIDVDGCVDGGKLDDRAFDIARDLNTYTEYSPSGTGLRLFAVGVLPGDDFNQNGVEMYADSGARFLTVTGHVAPSTPGEPQAPDPEVINRIYSTYNVKMSKTKKDTPASDVLDDFARICDEANITRVNSVDPLKVWSALQSIDPDCGYDTWITVGMSLRSIGTEVAHEQWIGWCKGLGSREKSGGDYTEAEKYVEGEPEAKWDSFTPEGGTGIGTLFHIAKEHGWDGKPAIDPAVEEIKAKFPCVMFDDAQPNLDRPAMIPGVMAPGSMIVTYGDSNVGKTFAVLRRDIQLAAGLPWYGKDTPGGLVVYLAAEDPVGLIDRVAAYKGDSGLSGVPFAVVPKSINLVDPAADVPYLLEFIRNLEKETSKKCIKLTQDTLSRALMGGNENDSGDMGALVMNADTLRQELGCAFEFIHHCGKNAAQGARGHSLLRAATDTEFEVTMVNGSRVMTATKQRHFKGGDQYFFNLKVIHLGIDTSGEMVSTCVATEVDAKSVDSRPTLKAGAQTLLDALINLESRGDGTTEKLLRAELKALDGDLHNFKRLLSTLLTKGYVEESLDGYKSIPCGD